MRPVFDRRIQRMVLFSILALAAGQLTLLRAQTLTATVVLLLAALGHFLALIPLMRRFKRGDQGSRQTSERLLAVGVGLLAISLSARAWTWMLVAVDPEIIVPSAADMFSLAGLLAAAGGLLWLRLHQTRRFGRIRTIFDYSILVTAVLSLAWLVFLDPPITLRMADFPTVLWLGMAPMLDLALLAILLRLRLTGALRGAGIHGLGLFAWIVLRLSGDLVYGFAFLQQQLIRPTPSAVGWLLSGAALWSAFGDEPADRQEEIVVRAKRPPLSIRLGRSLPAIAAYLVVGFTILDRWGSGAFNPFAVITGGVLLMLLLARQGVISGQAEMMQYASLVNSAADMAFVVDLEGGFILTNPAFQRATGAQPEAKSRDSLWDVVENEAQVRDALERATHGGWSGELQFLTSQGEPFAVQLSLAPVFDEGRGELVVAGTGHDLTETKQREQQLRHALTAVDQTRAELARLNVGLERKVSERTSELNQLVTHLETLNEELKELDQLKSEFVTLVSHELRSPLTNIRSGLELTLRRERKVLSESGAEDLEIVLNETGRLTSFVETILDLSALEAGRFPMNIRSVDSRIMIPTVRNRFPRKQASRISFTPPDPTPMIRADEPGLASVLFHLLDNAVKYSTGKIEVQVSKHGDQVVVSVLDSGPGIPASHREAIFDRFHRLDSSDSREVYGHGLGLYLCRRLTEAMRGTVTLSTDHSPGARFDVALPAAKPTGESTREMDQDRRAGTQESAAG